jgi:hypothetical protein
MMRAAPMVGWSLLLFAYGSYWITRYNLLGFGAIFVEMILLQAAYQQSARTPIGKAGGVASYALCALYMFAFWAFWATQMGGMGSGVQIGIALFGVISGGYWLGLLLSPLRTRFE